MLAYINFAEALKEVHVYQNANYGGRRSFFRLLVANYRSIPDGRTRASVTIGHDRVDIARNDFLSFPPLPPIRKAIRIGVQFYGSMVLSSEFRQQRSVPIFSSPIVVSLALASYLPVSVSLFPSRIPLRSPVLSHETLRNYCPMKLDVIHVPDVHDSFTARTASKTP